MLNLFEELSDFDENEIRILTRDLAEYNKASIEEKSASLATMLASLEADMESFASVVYDLFHRDYGIGAFLVAERLLEIAPNKNAGFVSIFGFIAQLEYLTGTILSNKAWDRLPAYLKPAVLRTIEQQRKRAMEDFG